MGEYLLYSPQHWALLWRLEDLKQADAQGAQSVNRKAFVNARAFIGALPSADLPLPRLNLAEDGEVNLCWNLNGFHADLGFYGTDTFSYYARAKNGEELFGDDLPVVAGLPHALLMLLSGQH